MKIQKKLGSGVQGIKSSGSMGRSTQLEGSGVFR